MRKVFISYSIEDSNLHLITLLLEHLRNNNYDVILSKYGLEYPMNILNANLFIGIITHKSKNSKNVEAEWQIAKKNNIQNILIVEEGVTINDHNNISYIRFNRSNPQDAIDKLFQRNKPTTPQKNKKNNDDVAANILLGVAVVAGIAALISLLSKNN